MNKRELFDKVWEIQQEIIATREMIVLLKREEAQEKWFAKEAERKRRAAERERCAAEAIARDPTLPTEGPNRQDYILRAWRNGETSKDIAARLGITPVRVLQLIHKRERAEREALDAHIGGPLRGRVLYDQTYEFYPEEPDVPVVRLPPSVRRQAPGGWGIEYLPQEPHPTNASTSKAGTGS